MAQFFSQAATGGVSRELGSRFHHRARSNGFTLVEILVAMAITLLIMATVVTVFSDLGTSVADARSSIEMSDQVQGVRSLLQSDLSHVTVTTKPWLRLESGAGYFEVIEGPRSDLITTTGDPKAGVINTTNATQLTLPATTRVPRTGLGDFDDVLMFTASNPESPYYGRVPGAAAADVVTAQSTEAEIIWFAVEHAGSATDTGELGFRTIYRRVLLVAPGFVVPSHAHSLSLREFYEKYDLSVKRLNNQWVPNSLADLTWRVNRFAHSGTFPHLVELDRIRPYNDTTSKPSPLGPLGLLLTERTGQDVMLRNALAFDVRVYDPQAPLRQSSSGIFVAPGEPGWAGGTNVSSAQPSARGAFVDLNYAGSSGISWFSGPSRNVSTSASLFAGNWDTWPFAYEQTPISGVTTGRGSNGLDDDSDGIVDDPDEFETSPPYIAPLRGVMVKIRGYEPYSRQMRDVSVVENFVGN